MNGTEVDMWKFAVKLNQAACLFVTCVAWLMCTYLGNIAAQSMPSWSNEKAIFLYLDQPFPGKVRPWIRNMKQSSDSMAFTRALESLTQELNVQGFVEAGADSIIFDLPIIAIHYHIGNQYFLNSLTIARFPEEAEGYRQLTRLQGKSEPFSPEYIQEVLKMGIEWYGSNGYPFAAADSGQVDFTKRDSNVYTVDVNYAMVPGERVRIDTIVVTGNKRESDAFILNLAGLDSGMVYDQQKIDDLQRVLNNSIYVTCKKPPVIRYPAPGSATLLLNLEQKKAGRFDLLLGLLPPSTQNAKTQFTGQLDISLVSPIFSAGEQLQFKLDMLQATSRRLNLSYRQPWFLGTPFSPGFSFQLYKQDSTFVNRWFRTESGFALSQLLSVTGYWKRKTSVLVYTDPWEQDSTRTPPVLDGRENLYGLSLLFNSMDQRLNPTRGWRIEISGGRGTKQVVRNPRLSEYIYKQLTIKQQVQELEWDVRFYHLFFPRQVLVTGFRGYWLRQEQYFLTDLLQTGGALTIRGFNENQFYAATWVQGLLEYRYILEQNSYLFGFAEYSYLENPVTAPFVQHPISVGFGITYETRAGLVSVSYGIGRNGDAGFQPTRGRVHIGLVNLF